MCFEVWLDWSFRVGIIPGGVAVDGVVARHRVGRRSLVMREVSRALVFGPLAEYSDGFREELDRLGYTLSSREFKMHELAGLSRWLGLVGLEVGDINEQNLLTFFEWFVVDRGTSPGLTALMPLLNWLRHEGLIGPARPKMDDSPVGVVMAEYCDWMRVERGLADTTVRRNQASARLFLEHRIAMTGGIGLGDLASGDVTAFLLGEGSKGLSFGSVQTRFSEVRTFLKFLYQRGLVSDWLADAVPSVPRWRNTSLPATLSASQVKLILDSCNLATEIGARDYAMLLLLGRLGLRALEVASLELDDIDWNAGDFGVRGKTSKLDRMPLPSDVGDALATYIAKWRRPTLSRGVFMTVDPPFRVVSRNTVTYVVYKQCVLIGIQPVYAHRLRHSLASELLASGVKMSDISQVLRHRNIETTAIYAKVDLGSLTALAPAWPTVAS